MIETLIETLIVPFYIIWNVFSEIFILLGRILFFAFTLPIKLFYPTFNIDDSFNSTLYFWTGLIAYAIMFKQLGVLSFPSSSDHSENKKIEVFSYDFESKFPQVVVKQTQIDKLKN